MLKVTHVNGIGRMPTRKFPPSPQLNFQIEQAPWISTANLHMHVNQLIQVENKKKNKISVKLKKKILLYHQKENQ